MARSKAVAVVALVAICFAGAARAEAQPSEADRIFDQGRKAAEGGDYPEACRLFASSFRLDPAIGTLLNLGDCSHHQGLLQEAFDYYDAARSRMKDSDDRLPLLRDRMRRLEQDGGRLSLHLTRAAPPGTVVTLDDVVFDAKRSAPYRVSKGPHVILVTAVGYRGSKYTIDVAAGETKSFDIGPGEELEMVLPGAAATDVPTGSPGRALRIAGFAALAAGVAGVWTGSIAGVVALERKGVQSRNCDAQNVCNVQGFDAAQGGARWATVSTVAFAVGAGVAALGAVFLVLGLTKGAPRSGTAIHVGLGSVALGGTF
ncbi:MAG TPA: hypothetical protein VF316_10635 [Polyangiaceae bacterium]